MVHACDVSKIFKGSLLYKYWIHTVWSKRKECATTFDITAYFEKGTFMKVVVASTNGVKIDAATRAFTSVFPDTFFEFEGVSAQSGVADQPMSDDETSRGAYNRLSHARGLCPDADYWVSFEGGLEDRGGKLRSVIWVVIQDSSGEISAERCSTFTLPPQVEQLVRSGLSLGAADDIVFNKTGSNKANGAIGLLTHDILTRTSVYRDGCVMALIPFQNEALYKKAG
jgi:inosine/xanthosine triphosphatase